MRPGWIFGRMCVTKHLMVPIDFIVYIYFFHKIKDQKLNISAEF